MTTRTGAIIRKEVRELLRDPVYLGLAFAVPLLLMFLFGYGLSMDVKHLRIAFVDQDNSFWSREYADSFIHSEYFDFVGTAQTAAQARQWMRAGRARAIVEIPAGFGRELASGHAVPVAVTLDGSFPTRAEIAQGYVSVMNALYNAALLADFAGHGGRRPALPQVEVNMSVWYNPSLESINGVVPGMLVLIMMLFPAMLGSLLVVREKEAGTIFNLYASPARRWEILLGKAVPYVAVAFIDYLLIYAMSVGLFQLQLTGSFWVLSAAALLYSACTIGIGMLVSVVTRTQLAAMLITMIGTVTPAFNYSGLTTPVSSLDATGQFIAHLIPATYFMGISRGSYLKGLGFQYYWPDLLSLLVYAVAVYSLAWSLLKKRMG